MNVKRDFWVLKNTIKPKKVTKIHVVQLLTIL